MLGLVPGRGVEHAQRAAELAGGGDHVGGVAGSHRPPHQAGARPRVEATREHGGQLRHEARERVGEVLGEVRARRVPAAAGERDLDAVGRARDRSLAQAHLADVERRVAVQRDDAGDPAQDTGREQPERAAGHDLLRGLEDQADPARQAAGHVQLLQGHGGPDERGHVDVVAAGVGDAGRRRAPRVGGGVVDREGVEVGPQRHDRTLLGSDLGHEPGALEAVVGDAQLVHPRGDHVGGALLVPGQLGARVQVTPQLDEIGRHDLDRAGDGVDGHSSRVSPAGDRRGRRPGPPAA